MSVGLKTSHTLRLTSGPRPALMTATGELSKHYGLRTVVKAKNFEWASQLLR